MKRYILTGTPGAGKTSLIRMLETQGYFVVNEAATDVIALEQAIGNKELWLKASFIDKIVNLQKQRQVYADEAETNIQFFDRSPFCTYALCKYLGYKIPDSLTKEISRIKDKNIYETQVFFIRNLGFVENTEARQINFEEAKKFEQIHEQVYSDFGYELVNIDPAPIVDRVEQILDYI